MTDMSDLIIHQIDLSYAFENLNFRAFEILQILKRLESQVIYIDLVAYLKSCQVTVHLKQC